MKISLFLATAAVYGLTNIATRTTAFQPVTPFQRHHELLTTHLSAAALNDDEHCPEGPVGSDRRGFLFAATAASASLWNGFPQPAAAAASTVDYKAVSADIAELVKNNPNWGPVRLYLYACWVCSAPTHV